MTRNSIRLLMTALLAPSWLQAQAGSGTVSGQVLDERQRPLYGARIDISAVPGPLTPFRPFQTATLTAADGTFTFNAAAGSYRVCAQLRASDLLDPCMWSKKPPVIDLKPGQTVRMRPLVLMRGYPLTVRLTDAQGLLAQEAAKRSGKAVMVEVADANGLPHLMPVRQQDPTAREHVIVVPRDTPLNISLHNQGFQIADDKGNAVASAGAHAFTAKIAGERTPRVFTFVVTGTGPTGKK